MVGYRDDEDKPREIVALDVREVSGVDRAANLREVVELKRQGSSEMDEEQLELVTKMLEDAGFTWVEKQMPPDLKSAVGLVMPFLQKSAAQAEGELKAALMKVRAYLGKAAAGSFPSPAPQKSSKASDEMTEDEKKEKAEKRRRAGKLNSKIMAEGVMKLLESFKAVASPEAFKSLMATVKELPDDLNFTSGVRPMAPTSKGADDEVLGILNELKNTTLAVQETTKSLATRMDKVEQTRPAPQGGGGDGKQPTEKKQADSGSFRSIVGC